jgi:hypothetical protein
LDLLASCMQEFPTLSYPYKASKGKWSFCDHSSRRTLSMIVPSLHLSTSCPFTTFSNYQNQTAMGIKESIHKITYSEYYWGFWKYCLIQSSSEIYKMDFSYWLVFHFWNKETHEVQLTITLTLVSRVRSAEYFWVIFAVVWSSYP